MCIDTRTLHWPRADRPIQRACSLDLTPVDRPESSLSGSSLGRPDSRPTGNLSWGDRSAGWPTAPMARNLIVSRSTGRSTGKPFLAWSGPQRLYFGNPINMGSLGLFLLRFLRANFLTFSSVFNNIIKKNLVPKFSKFSIFICFQSFLKIKES